MSEMSEHTLNSKILIVDDNPTNVLLLEHMLSLEGYKQVHSTTDPRDVEPLHDRENFDLILLDIRMPHMDGFEVMEKLSTGIKDDYLPVLVLTAQKDKETKLRSLELGAKDFIIKPFDSTEVLNRISNMLEVRGLYREKKNQAKWLEVKVAERTAELDQRNNELKLTRYEIVHSLGRAGEYRDNETGFHVIRMSKSCELIALAAGLNQAQRQLILHASPMHDVGKIGIPDHILLKPGALNSEEWEIMKTHVEIGVRILGTQHSNLMNMARSIAQNHHEKWDGTGYPVGLKGKSIPIEGRISAICDVFDALTSNRPYKQAWPLEDATSYMNEQAGRHFEQFENQSPQLILLDALMPRMNGFEAAVKIKQLAGETLIPIIFLTSLKDAESLAKGLSAGGDDFLSKPYNRTILKAKIGAFNRMRLNHQHLQQALRNLEKSQTRLVEREKMASLGELVAGIAHEVNTPIGIGITAISHLGNVINRLREGYQAETLTPKDLENFIEEATEGVGITQKNMNHAAELIKSFKQVAVDQASGNQRNVNLKQHFQDILVSLKPQFNKVKHQIQVDCDATIQCTCNAGALTQIVTNLIMNSLIHGFEGIDEGHIHISLKLEGSEVKLVYTDDGNGMKDELLRKIFEPFFTTKRGKGGSGLGTHIIYNQVNQALGGEISVSSSLGEGIRFDITFPQEGPSSLAN